MLDEVVAAILDPQKQRQNDRHDDRGDDILDFLAVDDRVDDLRDVDDEHDDRGDQMRKNEARLVLVQTIHQQQNEDEPDRRAEHDAALADSASEVHVIGQFAGARRRIIFVVVGDAEEVENAHHPDEADQDEVTDGDAPCHLLDMHLVAASVIVLSHFVFLRSRVR